jgi:hypothetical protein
MQRRGLRLRPRRLLCVLALSALTLWGLRWAHATPYVALSWPAPDPLGVRSSAPQMQPVAEAQLDGRGLAVQVLADGTTMAAVVDAGRMWLVVLWPDERQTRTAINLPGEPSHASFATSERLVVWVPDPAGNPGGTLAVIPSSTSGAARASISPLWQVNLPGLVFGLVPLEASVAVIAGGPEGVPHTCMVVAISDGKTLWQVQVGDGLITAWDGAIPGCGVALAGAEYDGQQVFAFVRLYSASGKLLGDIRTEEGPAYLVRLSPTGRYVLVVTKGRARLAVSDGTVLWSAALPAVRVEGGFVGADGQVLLSTTRNTLALGQRGIVRGRWRNPGLSIVAAAPGRDAVALGFTGGATLLDAGGRIVANVRGSGVSTLIGIDTGRAYLCRAADGIIVLYAVTAGTSR